jgi:tRNA pseudouridine38-40 synthase
MQPVATETGGGGLLRVRLDIAYDGTDFSGWASQPGRRTVQGVLEQALATVLRIESPRLTVAGRTDAGVHATGQVCHFDIDTKVWSELPGQSDMGFTDALIRRLAGVLPADLRVRSARIAPAGFDARFSAVWRRYRYRVADTISGPDPLRRLVVFWYPRPVDIAAMNTAATALIGTHDFAAFCRPREGATTIRTVRTLMWERGEDDLAMATIEADAFCHNQMRAMVGALLAVGDGRRSTGWPAQVLAAGVRDSAVTVVPPHGLTLEAVGYPPDDQLAARVVQVRRKREMAEAEVGLPTDQGPNPGRP